MAKCREFGNECAAKLAVKRKICAGLLCSIFLICCEYGLTQPSLVWAPGGEFFMGDSSGNPDERPVHRVTIDGFFIAATETTYGEFADFVRATGYRTDAERGDGSFVWDSLGWHKRDGVSWRHDEKGRLRTLAEKNAPVLHVGWTDAVRYCNWLSEREKRRPVYRFSGDNLAGVDFSADGYRLPTEAEWEYVARQGARHDLAAVGWYAGNSRGRARPVGQKKAAPPGVYDLAGNVWEWCHDGYDPNYYRRSDGARNPTGADPARERSLRGGSWNNNPSHCRAANRSSRFPDFRDGSVGFRVLRKG